MAEPPDDLEAAIDRLYQLPVAAFTEARNTLAAARRAAGDTDGASRVKALVKPSVVAWAVNQVFWSERAAFDRVVEAVREVLAAQRGALVGDADVDVRGAMRRKGEALQAAVRVAERKVEEAGGTVGSGFEQRVVSHAGGARGSADHGWLGGSAARKARRRASGLRIRHGAQPGRIEPAHPAPCARSEQRRHRRPRRFPTRAIGGRARDWRRRRRSLVGSCAKWPTRSHGSARRSSARWRLALTCLRSRSALGLRASGPKIAAGRRRARRSRLAELRRALTAAEAERDRARGLVR